MVAEFSKIGFDPDDRNNFLYESNMYSQFIQSEWQISFMQKWLPNRWTSSE